MSKNKHKPLVKNLLVVLIIIIASCSPVKKLSFVNLSHLYEIAQEFAEPEVEVYHTGDSLSEVFVLVRLHELLYAKEEGEDKFKTSFSLHYDLFTSFESREVVDSATHYYVDSTHFGVETEMIVDFRINARFPESYQMQLTLTDLNRQKSFLKIINVDKTDIHNRQNYLLTDTTGLPVFRTYLRQDEPVYIQTTTNKSDRLFVRYYNRNLGVARPPFSNVRRETFDFTPDSLFIIPFDNQIAGPIIFPDTGIYHIQEDTSRKAGLTLFRFHEGFPGIETPKQAMMPLRYLTTNKEFSNMVSAGDYKSAVDSFWLERGKNPERAKALIQKYYSRVEKTNHEFTSYLEGWKTDRGIIYAIFGPPTIVYRSSDTEEWTYGEEGNILSITYVFVNVENPFTDNDYRLVKSPSYKQVWYLGVEAWRR